MQYQTALAIWGLKTLKALGIVTSNATLSTHVIKVSTEINQGYSCCGGSDPDCYCSLAESPSLVALISCTPMGSAKATTTQEVAIDSDFTSFLGEVLKATEGTITL